VQSLQGSTERSGVNIAELTTGWSPYRNLTSEGEGSAMLTGNIPEANAAPAMGVRHSFHMLLCRQGADTQ
jgi:hypothetical protein